MRLITYRRDATTAPALLKDSQSFPSLRSDTRTRWLSSPRVPRVGLRSILQLEETGLNLLAPLSSVTLEAPLSRPAKILCIGLNYRDHAVESKMEPPKFPTVFPKYPLP